MSCQNNEGNGYREENMNMDFDSLIFILEMIGDVAFAVSGVFVAKNKKMDLFGAIILGCATSVGGGMIRDLILGETPPAMFRKPVYVLVAFISSLITFIILYNGRRAKKIERLHLLSTADSIGLAAFVVVGARTAYQAGFQSTFLACFVGVLTGIGGGILRDMMAGQMPLIMRRRIYGVAAVAGAIIYCLLSPLDGGLYFSASVSIFVTILIRLLAIKHRWNLPTLK